MFSKKSVSKKRVLIVEEDVEFTISMSRLLSREGYQVFAANSCENAFKHLDSLLFGLVFFNLNDPKHCNLQDLQTVINHAQKPRVVVMSSYDEDEIKARAISLGAVHYLAKPVKKDDFIRLLTTPEITP